VPDVVTKPSRHRRIPHEQRNRGENGGAGHRPSPAFAAAAGHNAPVSGEFSEPPGGEGAGQPVSWLQIEQGWTVVDEAGGSAGEVVSVAGDKSKDIFDGLAISHGGSAGPLYVPSEQVGSIAPGRVTLHLSAEAVARLEPFRPPPPETVWRPPPPSWTTRLSNWLRGKR
jgi:hypothetical protein